MCVASGRGVRKGSTGLRQSEGEVGEQRTSDLDRSASVDGIGGDDLAGAAAWDAVSGGELLDEAVDALTTKLLMTMPSCLSKTIESVRKHKLAHWDRNRETNRAENCNKRRRLYAEFCERRKDGEGNNGEIDQTTGERYN